MRELDKMDLNWAVLRLPRDVAQMLRDAGGRTLFVAGGFIRDCITGQPPQDIDLFSPTKEDAEVRARLLGTLRGTDPIDTDNASTVRGEPAVQFIHRWVFDTPEKCLDSFDFTIAQAAIWYDKESERWMGACSDRFYTDLAAKRLVYTSPVRLEEAGGSMLRVLKFYQRGYRIDLDSLGKVIARVSCGDKSISVDEERHAFAVSGLLREVDPSIDPNNLGYLMAVQPHHE